MRRFILILLLFGSSSLAIAQTNGTQFTLPTVLPIAPNSASLGRYGDIPVSTETGVPDISIPLYTIKSGNLSLPISINYHGSGIKLTDMAGPAGLGWALNAGGSISRTIQGIEDDNNHNSGYQGFYYQIFPDPNDPSLAAEEKCIGANICNNYYDNGLYPTDGQPDLYYYNLASKSGKFILKNRVANAVNPGFMTIPYSPIQIAMPSPFQQFQITDVDGTNYLYGSTNPPTPALDYSQRVPTGSDPYFDSVATAWHLQKIVSVDHADSITFQYGFRSTLLLASANQVLIQNFNVPEAGSQWTFSEPNPTTTESTVASRLVTEIDFSTGKVIFSYSMPGALPMLDSITIYSLNSGQYSKIKQFAFFHSTFATATNNSYNYIRLDSLRESGYFLQQSNSNPPYVFSYYTYSGSYNYDVPPYTSTSYAQDFWGYFNGKTSNQNLLFVAPPSLEATTLGPVSAAVNREPDSNYLRVGTLQSIQYPTGGQTVFDFEPNQTIRTYQTDSIVPGTDLDGVHIYESVLGYVPSVQFTINDSLYTQYQANGSPYNAELQFSIVPVCTSGCIVNVSAVEVDDAATGSYVALIPLADIDNPNPPTTTLNINAYMTLTSGHTYILKFTTPVTLQSGESYGYLLDAIVTGDDVGQSIPVEETQTVLTGGLRIRQITSSDGFGKTLIKQYKYTQSYFNSSLFSGDFDALALGSFQFQGENWPYGGVAGDLSNCRTWGVATTTYTGNLALPIGAVTNNSISYSQVEEYLSDGNGNYNGKTVYTYNQADDVVTNNMPFYKIDREDLRTLLLDKKTYAFQNGNYALIQDDSTVYVDLDSLQNQKEDTVIFYTAHGLRDNLVTKETFGVPGTPVQTSYSPGSNPFIAAYDPQGNLESYISIPGALGCPLFDNESNFQINKYYYTSPKLVPRTTFTTLYGQTGNAVEKTTTYDYANPLHIFPTHTQTIDSKGQTVDDSIKYVLDYPASNCPNSADSLFSVELDSLKAVYFTSYGNDFSQFGGYTGTNQQNPSCYGLNLTDSSNVNTILSNYAQLSANYALAREQLAANLNTNIANQNSCAANYYAAASTDQKGIMDLQTQNNIIPQLQNKEVRNGVLMTTKQTFYNTFLPNVTVPERVTFATLNNPLEVRLQYLAYDNHSNLLSVEKAADMPVSYLWDYNHQYPIAEVKNADTTDMAFTSFESDASGGWTIGSGVLDSTTAITGYKSYNLSGSISRSGLSSSTTYIVSYWTENNSALSVSGTISGYPVQGKTETINGNNWTLYVHKVTGQSTITVSGSGHIDELRLYPSTAQMTTYTYSPLVGMTSQTDVGNRVTYYEYDGLQRLKRIRDQDYNILKTYEYQYQVPAGCNGCQTLAMETFLGTNTIGYPVGVFDIHGNLVGNAVGASAYVGLWNSDTADARVGTLSTGNDSLHFNIVLHTGQTLPASVTGCRYYQVDLPWYNIDGVRNFNGTYVDFGDGTRMRFGATFTDTPAVHPLNTVYTFMGTDSGEFNVRGVYYQHNYIDSSLKTLTFYHNDANERSDFDNVYNPANSMIRLTNLRGNFPLSTNTIGGSSYQQPTMISVANIANWSSIHSILYFRLNNGDLLNPCENISYPQDFLANDPGLLSIQTAYNAHRPGNGDSTFKLSRLKSNWNTYFTQLQQLYFGEDDWNHEDLSSLKNLITFSLIASSQNQNNPTSPLVPLDSTEIDNILIQIAAGAGQVSVNGGIGILTGGSNRTSNSDPAYNYLIGRGWTIYIDTTTR